MHAIHEHGDLTHDRGWLLPGRAKTFERRPKVEAEGIEEDTYRGKFAALSTVARSASLGTLHGDAG